MAQAWGKIKNYVSDVLNLTYQADIQVDMSVDSLIHIESVLQETGLEM